jgi:hypothetical protein
MGTIYNMGQFSHLKKMENSVYLGEQKWIFHDLAQLVCKDIPIHHELMYELFLLAIKQWEDISGKRFSAMKLVSKAEKIRCVNKVFKNLEVLIIDQNFTVPFENFVKLVLNKVFDYYIANYADRDFFD